MAMAEASWLDLHDQNLKAQKLHHCHGSAHSCRWGGLLPRLLSLSLLLFILFSFYFSSFFFFSFLFSNISPKVSLFIACPFMGLGIWFSFWDLMIWKKKGF
ncbi:hypothetical protein ACJW31_05G004000 [Castanea mollissima]